MRQLASEIMVALPEQNISLESVLFRK